MLRRSRLEYAAVEFALIMPTTDGRYTHRRVSCAGNDVLYARDHFFDPDPEKLAHWGHPSAPRRVEDQVFATLDQALQAAQTHEPAADPSKWEREWWFQEGGGFDGDELEPEAMRVGTAGRRVALAAGLAIFAAVIWWGIAQSLFAVFVSSEGLTIVLWVIVLAGLLGAMGSNLTERLLKRRNLARERSR